LVCDNGHDPIEERIGNDGIEKSKNGFIHVNK
jgi:hypothetical protein